MVISPVISRVVSQADHDQYNESVQLSPPDGARSSYATRALVPRERARLQTHLTPVHHVIERGAEAAVVLILERHEAERLKHSIRRLLCGAEDFGHAVHRAGLRLKSNFDEITLAERTRHV